MACAADAAAAYTTCKTLNCAAVDLSDSKTSSEKAKLLTRRPVFLPINSSLPPLPSKFRTMYTAKVYGNVM